MYENHVSVYLAFNMMHNYVIARNYYTYFYFFQFSGISDTDQIQQQIRKVLQKLILKYLFGPGFQS